MQNAKILIVDDDIDILTAGKLLLKRHFSDVTLCSDPKQIPNLLNSFRFDAILLDMNFGPGESSGAQGFQWLKTILSLDPQAVVVIITAHGGVKVAVEAMKLGATDFVGKPWENEKLVATVSAAVLLGISRSEASSLRSANMALTEASIQTGTQPIIAQSGAMQKVLSLIKRSGPTDANVLILGENGTGKELAARELHQQSLRADKVFLSVDLGAVSESLFESELFGHKKGAFTGAQQDRAGRLSAADGGTLFLDEIGNIPLHLQAKLLTVLEQRMVTPLGSNKAQPFDVRVISATNLSRSSLTNEQQFRQDLLFRLNTVEVNLPPLRDRTEDIAPIAQHYIKLYGKKYAKPDKALSPAARQAICSYHWPGNIRALRHAIERAIILSETAMLEVIDFQLEPHVAPDTVSSQPEQTISTSYTELPSHEQSSDLNLNRLEKLTVEKALKKHRYNISHAAKELGLTRAALYRRMEKHGL